MLLSNYANDILKQSVNQIFLNELQNKGAIEEARKFLEGAFYDETGQFTGLSDEELQQFQDLMTTAGEQAKVIADQLKVEELFGTQEAVTEQADISRAGQIQQAITEQTGSELVGRFTAMMLSNERIALASEDGLDYAIQHLTTLNRIKENTDFLPEIAENTRKTYENLSAT